MERLQNFREDETAVDLMSAGRAFQAFGDATANALSEDPSLEHRLPAEDSEVRPGMSGGI